MSAVWRTARAAVARRRVQTALIGLVVLCCTATAVLALGLLDAATTPFDRAFEHQRGAHVVASFDAAKADPGVLTRTAARPGVQAAAGPFGQVVADFPRTTDIPEAEGPLTIAGRPGPGGPVDRVPVLYGRWARAPGEIVLNLPAADGPRRPQALGARLTAPGLPPLTVVGLASSMSRSADAWVTPAQMAALRPRAVQMLYRFEGAATGPELRAAMAAVSDGLPAGALTSAATHLALRQAFADLAAAYLPLLTVFGVLALLVAVLIVAGVVSGAVVSGLRHIGVLKALGFTPGQVVAVYLTMVSVPAAVGAALGAAAGAALAGPVLRAAFQGVDAGVAEIGFGGWVPGVCLAGMPLLVAAAALVPALRARRLSAAAAISAGSAPRPGRGLRVQRALGGARLPRAVSLGLGLPFARPGRTAMTMAAIVVGLTSVTLTTGLGATMAAFAAADRPPAGQVGVRAGEAAFGENAPRLDDRRIEALLRFLPGARQVTAKVFRQVRLAGQARRGDINFQRGDTSPLAAQVVQGRWFDGPGQIVAPPAFLSQRGLAVGDRITLLLNGRRAEAMIVGRLMSGDARFAWASWDTLTALDPRASADTYEVRLAAGVDPRRYADAVKAADPGLHPSFSLETGTTAATVVGVAGVFTALLIAVAALGVFNTVLLTTRERRRDLGVLKSIGMTPRQVTVMTVTSVAAQGAAGALIAIPAGMLAHRLIVDNVGIVEFPDAMKDVFQPSHLAALALAGVVIAVLGALAPARSAARLTVAAVLHGE
ncbi:FtsX-like permease family protein [Spongiactinospora sp. 9N601]|uniref:ABC transporter permease n=1 Tax=Spongiactinospora sp. 9N601 TaxID=3375149 RepID=UPI00379DBDA1